MKRLLDSCARIAFFFILENVNCQFVSGGVRTHDLSLPPFTLYHQANLISSRFVILDDRCNTSRICTAPDLVFDLCIVTGISSSEAATVGLGAVQVCIIKPRLRIMFHVNIMIVNSVLVISFLFQVIATGISTWLVDKSGRRLLLMVSMKQNSFIHNNHFPRGYEVQ